MADKNPLISNISPPAELPSFILQQQPATQEAPGTSKPKFTPAIPPQPQQPKKETSEKPEPDEPIEVLPSMQDIAQALSPLTEGVKNSVLFGWVKDTVKSGMKSGVNIVDKVVTTLDPQMAQLICE